MLPKTTSWVHPDKGEDEIADLPAGLDKQTTGDGRVCHSRQETDIETGNNPESTVLPYAASGRPEEVISRSRLASLLVRSNRIRPDFKVEVSPTNYPAQTPNMANNARPRPVSLGETLCSVCYGISAWIDTLEASIDDAVHRRSCPRLNLDQLYDPLYTSKLGYLDEILTTTKCALCRLVSHALRACFGNLPLIYEKESIRYRQECGLIVSGLLGEGEAIGVAISLASFATIAVPLMSQDKYLLPTQRFGPELRVLFDDIHLVPAIAFGGKVARSISTHGCDIGELYRCYSFCLEKHGSICEATQLPFTAALEDDVAVSLSKTDIEEISLVQGMYVIDVIRMCVMNAPSKCCYLALSYVWGSSPFLRLTKGNLQSLQQEGSLQNEKLPRTFEHAIKLATLFGVNYLWIDALCIIQDDEVYKLNQILQMDRIYLSASLTIVAADGNSVEAGLSGFKDGPRRTSQVIEKIGGLRLVVMAPPLQNILETQNWYSRGWTYQEMAFSKRLLIFTSDQVYFRCNLRSFSEDSFFVEGINPDIRPPKKESEEVWNHPLWDTEKCHTLSGRPVFGNKDMDQFYRILAENVSPRELSKDADILRSIAGILRWESLFSKEKNICGLPSSILDWALLWQPLGSLSRREKSYSGDPFPSWSWIGWVGPVRYHTNPPLTGIKAMAQWRIFTPEKDIDEISNTSLDSSKKPEPPFRHFSRELLPYCPLVNPGETRRKGNYVDWETTRWTYSDWQITNQSSTNLEMLKYPAELIDRVQKHQTATDELEPLIESGILESTLHTALFTIDGRSTPFSYEGFNPSKTGSFRIKAGDDWVGTIHLDRTTAGADFGGGCGEAEFILLSLTKYGRETSDVVDRGQNTFDTDLFRELEVEGDMLLCNVMWILREGQLAFRKGVGQIHVDAWQRANPVPKRILLG